MSALEALESRLAASRHRWVVTGAAGFIGSHLVEHLLRGGQFVAGLDNFATGYRANLEAVRQGVGENAWARFDFVEADICDLAACHSLCRGADFILHQAPLVTNRANVDGFLNMLVAARDARVQRFVYAASSSTYGDHPGLPKVEDRVGRPLSPYAVTKYVNELYADVFARTYDLDCIGLRYFNVFGPRQDHMGAYAAVIPRWFEALVRKEAPGINGDGETSRDFCYIDNTVQANLLAALATQPEAGNQVYNIAVGARTSLNDLFGTIRALVADACPEVAGIEPVYGEFREGDVRHSEADIGKAQRLLGYRPSHTVDQGLAETSRWFIDRQRTRGK